ncbi:BolA/IbaG family iron-sulfur metabolism protein [Candidatus Pelagibacter sp.]|jgi:BolA family transcriptional regulator, general stress-responsive regulator|nr:BolA/IbaG family iron-sulfur metabolism protein [Candidatus Pelagibacter sp.]|tara:strand:- start:583 stop:843 length:261 start_codon:yes stop_codon:yes gene_type:complete
MNINQLISIIKNKLENNILFEDINIEDKTFLHRNHKGHKDGKFHIKITIKSTELKKLNKIQSTKKIYSILNQELKTHVHSIQILIN